MQNQATELRYAFEKPSVTMYSRSYGQGQRGQLWSICTGRSRRLHSLIEIETACTVRARSQLGVRAVPLDQIRGSESRGDDFDRDFNPLQNHTRCRWLSVARAWEQGKALPPVELIQIGDVFFVRDGHHRISVARAMGQLDVEAEVTVWKVTGALPWEAQTRAAAKKSDQRSLRNLLIAIGAKLRAQMVSWAGVRETAAGSGA